jgi:hypothetical protein
MVVHIHCSVPEVNAVPIILFSAVQDSHSHLSALYWLLIAAIDTAHWLQACILSTSVGRPGASGTAPEVFEVHALCSQLKLFLHAARTAQPWLVHWTVVVDHTRFMTHIVSIPLEVMLSSLQFASPVMS